MKEKIRTLTIHCHFNAQVVHHVQNSAFTVELSKLERKNNTADKAITKKKKKLPSSCSGKGNIIHALVTLFWEKAVVFSFRTLHIILISGSKRKFSQIPPLQRYFMTSI